MDGGKAEEETKIKDIGKVLAGLGTGRIHRCAVYNRGSCNAITCWIPIHRGPLIILIIIYNYFRNRSHLWQMFLLFRERTT